MKKVCLMLAAALCLAAAGCHPEEKPGQEVPGPGPVEKPDDEGDKPDTPVPDGMNVEGKVVDSDGKGIEGVVVTDGLQCTLTQADGSFRMKVDEATAKFIYISTPSGYMPTVYGGRPVFYRSLASQSKKNGVYTVDTFTLTPVAHPDRATVIFTADPQPRASSAGFDKIGYHSLDCCEDLYLDLKETRAAMPADRRVLGICLGDIVHENMSLYTNYIAGLKTLGYPTYNVLGNHDNNPSAADDEAAAADFESYFGPRNYSFNVGNIHFVVLDNLIMKDKSGRLTGYDQGLTDRIWEWLQADLSFVPKTATVATCSHSPMFKTQNGERSARHKNDYANLLTGYARVHAWAGHTHATHNFVYPEAHMYGGLEVHTLARSTGELWTNEYLSSGTPRGYTIAEIVDGEFASWRFHPVKYQRGAFIGPAAPSYELRDWDYDDAGVARMKAGGGVLDESYQMHLYAPVGTYGDSKVYANIFLWDSKWSTPVFTLDGGSSVQMVPVESASRYDFADTAFKTFYKTYNQTLKDYSGYDATTTGNPNTLFSTPVEALSGAGTVSVTDRFGKVYTARISW